MIFRRSKHQINPESGMETDETTEVWLADFGSDELEAELRQEVLKLKPRSEAAISWMLISVVLLVFFVVTELLLRQWGLKIYWSESNIFWASWLWRLILVIVWLSLARLRWLLSTDKMFITTLISFVSGVIILGVIKIIYIQSAWAWLNLLVEPIWMVLLIAFLGVLFVKFSKNNN